MIPRWKVLPHRLSNDRCRDCGRLTAYSAPDTCSRCSLEQYGDAGHAVVVNPVDEFYRRGYEQWRIVSRQLLSGQIVSDRFYLYVGHDDGTPLERPLDELLANERQFAHARLAYETGLDLTRRYPEVWVVTTVGAWRVSGDAG